MQIFDFGVFRDFEEWNKIGKPLKVWTFRGLLYRMAGMSLPRGRVGLVNLDYEEVRQTPEVVVLDFESLHAVGFGNNLVRVGWVLGVEFSLL